MSSLSKKDYFSTHFGRYHQYDKFNMYLDFSDEELRQLEYELQQHINNNNLKTTTDELMTFILYKIWCSLKEYIYNMKKEEDRKIEIGEMKDNERRIKIQLADSEKKELDILCNEKNKQLKYMIEEYNLYDLYIKYKNIAIDKKKEQSPEKIFSTQNILLDPEVYSRVMSGLPMLDKEQFMQILPPQSLMKDYTKKDKLYSHLVDLYNEKEKATQKKMYLSNYITDIYNKVEDKRLLTHFNTHFQVVRKARYLTSRELIINNDNELVNDFLETLKDKNGKIRIDKLFPNVKMVMIYNYSDNDDFVFGNELDNLYIVNATIRKKKLGDIIPPQVSNFSVAGAKWFSHLVKHKSNKNLPFLDIEQDLGFTKEHLTGNLSDISIAYNNRTANNEEEEKKNSSVIIATENNIKEQLNKYMKANGIDKRIGFYMLDFPNTIEGLNNRKDMKVPSKDIIEELHKRKDIHPDYTTTYSTIKERRNINTDKLITYDPKDTFYFPYGEKRVKKEIQKVMTPLYQEYPNLLTTREKSKYPFDEYFEEEYDDPYSDLDIGTYSGEED